MKRAKAGYLAASTLVLAACANLGPQSNNAPDMPSAAPAEFRTDPAIDTLSSEPAHDWYRQGGDPVLAALVERAFEENRDLRMAAANLNAARAVLRLQQTGRRPTGEVDASASFGEQSTAGQPGTSVSADPELLYTIGAGASWELDFFGRIARLTEAAAADAEAAAWLRRDAEVLVAAETVRAYIDLRTAETGIRIASENLRLQSETLEITQARLEEGLGSRLDVARAEAQVRTTEASIPPYEGRKEAALNRLATLTGQSLANLREAAGTADGTEAASFPDGIEIGDVQGLMQRRADIRAAERELAAATARAGAVRADYFPRISLIGTVSAGATDAGEFGGPGSIGFGIGPRLVWGGFDRPRMDARLAVAEADVEARFARYEKTVLVALEETQTALATYGRERVRLVSLGLALDRAREAAELARLRFEEGADDFLNVLDADSRLLVAEADRLESRANAARALVEIYRTLGAGWQSPTGI